MPRSTCRACGAVFGGVSGFDKHRVGRYIEDAPHYVRRCLTAEELYSLGFLKNHEGWYIPMSNTARDALRAARVRNDVTAIFDATGVPATLVQGSL